MSDRCAVMLRAVVLASAAAVSTCARGQPADFGPAECIAPAKPGGGFDITCKLAQRLFADTKLLAQPMRVSYMPGGIGAVAYKTIVAERPAERGTLVAFSGGSLLNLAQGKFGKHNMNDVRWVASIGADYGVVAVRTDAPWQTLKDLERALKANPQAVMFGAGGVIGTQDWMKAALTVRAAGADFKAMRFTAFEGGGEAFEALAAGKVQVVAGDAGEVSQLLERGAPVRLLAVMAPKRLEGRLATVPTAREQGYDIRWPIVRGYYVGPKVSDADYDAWVRLFAKAMATPEFRKLRDQLGLYAYSMTGLEAEAFVKASTIGYRQLIRDFGLPLQQP